MLTQIIEFPGMEVLIGRSSFIPICVEDGIKTEFMGQQKLGCVWNKKSGSRGGKSAGKAKETARAFERITGCPVGWAEGRAVRERVRTQIIKAVWPVAKILALIINVMENWYFKLGRVASLHGEGKGTPLQYSCLENPMDGGAW